VCDWWEACRPGRTCQPARASVSTVSLPSLTRGRLTDGAASLRRLLATAVEAEAEAAPCGALAHTPSEGTHAGRARGRLPHVT
jgi:adenosylcobinamide amidohydrolase